MSPFCEPRLTFFDSHQFFVLSQQLVHFSLLGVYMSLKYSPNCILSLETSEHNTELDIEQVLSVTGQGS